MPLSQLIFKRLFTRAIFASLVFVAPAYFIKWGQLHPHINWPQYLKTAWSVGLTNSPIAHREFYTAHFHWQELACLLIFVAISLQCEYLMAAYGAADSGNSPLPRTKRAWRAYLASYLGDEEKMLWAGTCTFLYLYVAVCALCERTQMGMITTFVSTSIDSMIRDAGIVIVTYFLFKTMTVISAGVYYNGMVIRTDLQRTFNWIGYSLIGLALTFSSWLPLLALPGARIASNWLFIRLRESRAYSNEADSKTELVTDVEIKESKESKESKEIDEVKQTKGAEEPTV